MSGKFHKRSQQPNNDGVSDPVEEVIDPVVTEDDPEIVAEHDDGEDASEEGDA